MDETQKQYLSGLLRSNEWFLEGIEKAIAVERKQLEFGDPNNPDALVAANHRIRAIRRLRDDLLRPSKPPEEKTPR